jgi:hypothetical protein
MVTACGEWHPSVVMETDDERIVNHLFGFRDWANNNMNTRSAVRPGSDAESDAKLAGSGWVVPSGIVEGLINSTTDHLLAWFDKCVTQDEPPEVRLSAYADYTLLRPPIECLANLVWMLAPDGPKERVSRSLRFANIELQHGKKLIAALLAAGTPDAGLARTFASAEPFLITAAEAAGLDPARVLGTRIVDETSILRSIGPQVGGPTFEALAHWARASAHAHSQILTVLTLSDRSRRSDPHGPYLYSEVNSRALADSCELLLKLLNVAVDLLNRRGYERLRTAEPHMRLRPGNTP